MSDNKVNYSQWSVIDKIEYFTIPEEKKQTVEGQIKISFGDTNQKKSTEKETKYYDSNDKELGSVAVFEYKDPKLQIKTATVIRTPDASYYDWDNNGTIDSKTTYTIHNIDDISKKISRTLRFYGYTAKDLNIFSVEELLLKKGFSPLDIIMFQNFIENNKK